MKETTKAASQEDRAARLLDMVRLVARLRGENGCPWDKKQTAKSLRVYLLEETYELIEAIESEKTPDIAEELGDVFFQVVFLSRIFEEQGLFTLFDVAQKNVEKMKARHPHVFGDVKIDTAEDVRKRWHELKQNGKKEPEKTGALDSVPKGLPSLHRAYRLSERAARVGFDWENVDHVMEKLDEEVSELKEALQGNDKSRVEDELGDLLFTLVNVGRKTGVHPDNALKSTVEKFVARFCAMEKMAAEKGLFLDQSSMETLESLWEAAKKGNIQ